MIAGRRPLQGQADSRSSELAGAAAGGTEVEAGGTGAFVDLAGGAT